MFKILPARPTALGGEALGHAWESTRTGKAAASVPAASPLGTCGRELPKHRSQSSHGLNVEATGLSAAGTAELWYNGGSSSKSDPSVPTAPCAGALVPSPGAKPGGLLARPPTAANRPRRPCAGWALARRFRQPWNYDVLQRLALQKCPNRLS